MPCSIIGLFHLQIPVFRVSCFLSFSFAFLLRGHGYDHVLRPRSRSNIVTILFSAVIFTKGIVKVKKYFPT